MMQLYNNVSRLRHFRGSEPGFFAKFRCLRIAVCEDQEVVRMTWISRSLIFLRKVLRFTRSRSAARI